jgi:hypothetical protein
VIETQVQNKIVEALNRVGIWAFRVCAEARRGHTPGAPEGTFDIHIPGSGAWIETKMLGKKLSPGQLRFAAMCDRHNVRHCLILETKYGGWEVMVSEAISVARFWMSEDQARKLMKKCPLTTCPMEEK